MHYGIYGMKWGIRRYQNSDGTLTEAGKRRYRTSGNGEFEDEKGEKRYGKDVRKQTKSDEKLEKRKQKAIASGSVDNILKMRSYMTSQELTDAVNRVRNMETLRANTPEKLQKAEDRAELAARVQTLGNVATGISNATNIYNNTAKIFNVLPFDKQLPIIGEKKDGNIRKSVKDLLNAGRYDILSDHMRELTMDEIAAINKRAEADAKLGRHGDLYRDAEAAKKLKRDVEKKEKQAEKEREKQEKAAEKAAKDQAAHEKAQAELRRRQEEQERKEAERERRQEVQRARDQEAHEKAQAELRQRQEEQERKEAEKEAQREADAMRRSTVRVAKEAAVRAASMMDSASTEAQMRQALELGQRATNMVNSLNDVPSSVRQQANSAYASLLAQYGNRDFNWDG